MRAGLSLLLLLTAVLLSPAAWGQRIIHRVRFNETLASISKHYYDSERHAELLRLVNGLGQESKLQPGQHIRVPTTWTCTVHKASTLAALARRYLGDRRRWPALSVFNKLGRKRRIASGQQIIIPFSVIHQVAPGETFESLAQLYYQAERYASLVASHNFIKAEQPEVGTRLSIPVGDVRITTRRMEELVNTRLLDAYGSSSRDLREAFQEANAMLRRGDYWQVPLRLVRLLAGEQSSDAQMAEVFKLLAIAYVALDRPEWAVKAFQEALLRRPDFTLDPVATSPKVMRVYLDAKSRVKEGSP